MSHRLAAAVFLITGSLLMAGAGCGAPAPMEEVRDLTRMSPGDAARAIEFHKGAGFEIHQRALKVQNEWVHEDAALSSRVVTLTSYAPPQAELQWTLQQKVLTDEYKEALDAFRTGATTTEPEVSYGLFITAGSLKPIFLQETHKLLTPSLWADGEGHADGSSGVWLSQTVYEELSRTGVSTVYLNFFDQVTALAAGKPELSAAIEALRAQVVAAQERTDLDLMKADAGRSTMTLQVNGAEISVQTIKARNWYGEVTVLDNPANPLVLKFVMNPPVAASATTTAAGMAYLNDLLSFEITRLDF